VVAYSFKSSFLDPIFVGEKRQTIRLPRKRHACPGEALQFFTGPRMKPVRIGEAVCQSVCEVRLDFDKHEVVLDDAISIVDRAELNAFAVRDGFRCDNGQAGVDGAWCFMSRWWRLTHPDQPVFLGVLINWDQSFEPTPGFSPEIVFSRREIVE